MEDHAELIRQLRQRVAKLPPLPDEPDFNTSDETLERFLKSRDWKLEEASRMLVDSIQYRRVTRPQTLDCSWCHNRPGYHSMRQVGHDLVGRPVVYSSFVQAATNKNSVEDSVTHVSYLIENAKRTMGPGVTTWVFVVDCTSMTLGACNPKIGYGMSNLLSNHYPERLGMMVCVNHSPIFHGVWKAMKNFICPKTVAKVRMVRSKARMQEVFTELFDSELSEWLHEEIALNKQKPLPRTQVEFWSPLPSSSSPQEDGKSATAHDPRGCPSYVAQYVEGYRTSLLESMSSSSEKNPATTPPEIGGKGEREEEKKEEKESAMTANADENKATTENHGDGVGEVGVVIPRVHKPHPNIVDQLLGCKLERVVWTREEEQERQRARSMAEATNRSATANNGDVDDHNHDLDHDHNDSEGCELEIPSDLQIPAEAVPVSATS